MAIDPKNIDEIIDVVVSLGIPDKYPTTFFGNYTPETVEIIMIDLLLSFKGSLEKVDK